MILCLFVSKRMWWPCTCCFLFSFLQISTFNLKFTLFELWFRFVFLLLTFVIITVFAFKHRGYKWNDWTIEQKWVLLIVYHVLFSVVIMVLLPRRTCLFLCPSVLPCSVRSCECILIVLLPYKGGLQCLLLDCWDTTVRDHLLCVLSKQCSALCFYLWMFWWMLLV